MNELREALEVVLAGRSLDPGQTEAAVGAMLDLDPAPEPLIAGFLIALRMKGEAAGELTGGARAMRRRARPLRLRDGWVLDTAGTGGDGAGTFNISTGASLVAAAAGVPVAKHGNRAASGMVGAADALERMGVRLDLAPADLQRCLDQTGFCFIFAPSYHPVLARLAGLRRALGVRTLFNLIAPLANPCLPCRQLVGVGDRRLVEPMTMALTALGSEHALVVHGGDGLDEISLAASSTIAEVRAGKNLKEYQIGPASFGLSPAPAETLTAASPEQAIAMLREALGGAAGPPRDVLALNAGASIYVGGGAPSLEAGVARAQDVLTRGAALELLDKLRRVSNTPG